MAIKLGGFPCRAHPRAAACQPCQRSAAYPTTSPHLSPACKLSPGQHTKAGRAGPAETLKPRSHALPACEPTTATWPSLTSRRAMSPSPKSFLLAPPYAGTPKPPAKRPDWLPCPLSLMLGRNVRAESRYDEPRELAAKTIQADRFQFLLRSCSRGPSLRGPLSMQLLHPLAFF